MQRDLWTSCRPNIPLALGALPYKAAAPAVPDAAAAASVDLALVGNVLLHPDSLSVVLVPGDIAPAASAASAALAALAARIVAAAAIVAAAVPLLCPGLATAAKFGVAAPAAIPAAAAPAFVAGAAAWRWKRLGVCGAVRATSMPLKKPALMTRELQLKCRTLFIHQLEKHEVGKQQGLPTAPQP